MFLIGRQALRAYIVKSLFDNNNNNIDDLIGNTFWKSISGRWKEGKEGFEILVTKSDKGGEVLKIADFLVTSFLNGL